MGDVPGQARIADSARQDRQPFLEQCPGEKLPEAHVYALAECDDGGCVAPFGVEPARGIGIVAVPAIEGNRYAEERVCGNEYVAIFDVDIGQPVQATDGVSQAQRLVSEEDVAKKTKKGLQQAF